MYAIKYKKGITTFTKKREHAKKCPIMRAELAKKDKGGQNAVDVPPPNPPPRPTRARNESFQQDELDLAASLRIRYGLSRPVNPEVVAWVIRHFSNINSPRLTDMQVRAVTDNNQLPDRLAHMIQTLERENSKVALLNGIKNIYSKIKEAQAKRQ